MSFVERVNQGGSLVNWLNWLTEPPAVCWSVCWDCVLGLITWHKGGVLNPSRGLQNGTTKLSYAMHVHRKDHPSVCYESSPWCHTTLPSILCNVHTGNHDVCTHWSCVASAVHVYLYVTLPCPAYCVMYILETMMYVPIDPVWPVLSMFTCMSHYPAQHTV